MSKKYAGEQRPDWKEAQDRDEEEAYIQKREQEIANEKDGDAWKEITEAGQKEAELEDIKEEEDGDCKLQLLRDYEERYGALQDNERIKLGIQDELLEQYKRG